MHPWGPVRLLSAGRSCLGVSDPERFDDTKVPPGPCVEGDVCADRYPLSVALLITLCTAVQKRRNRFLGARCWACHVCADWSDGYRNRRRDTTLRRGIEDQGVDDVSTIGPTG